MRFQILHKQNKFTKINKFGCKNKVTNLFHCTVIQNFSSTCLLQIVNGRPRQATSVLLHLTGVAAGFVGQLTESRKSIDGAGKVRMLCGVLLSKRKRQLGALPTSGRFFSFSIKAGVLVFFFFFQFLYCV